MNYKTDKNKRRLLDTLLYGGYAMLLVAPEFIDSRGPIFIAVFVVFAVSWVLLGFYLTTTDIIKES